MKNQFFNNLYKLIFLIIIDLQTNKTAKEKLIKKILNKNLPFDMRKKKKKTKPTYTIYKKEGR